MILRALTLFVVFTSLITGGSAPARAENLVKIRLIPERSMVEPGETIRVGIEQSITPGWHTYWKNPGDSGTAPAVSWSLPPGFEAGPLQWPSPRKLPIGHLLNYGYEDSVILLQNLSIPSSLPDGPVTLKAKIELLVCKEECIPEFGEYSLTLNAESEEDNGAFLDQAAQKMPLPSAWDVQFTEEDSLFKLDVRGMDATLLDTIKPEQVHFLPADWGLVINADPPRVAIEDGVVTLRQKRDTRPLNALPETSGLIQITAPETGLPLQTYAITAQPATTQTASGAGNLINSVAPAAAPFMQAFIFALLGGLILNLMPCVFPVLSIKVLSLVKIAEQSPGIARMHGLAYTAGIVLSFVTIALVLIMLRAGGDEIGWGFQLQNPLMVTMLAYVVFIIGLNLAGVFEISGSLGNFGNKLAQGDGIKSSFFTGVLATLVATPCTAPFMGVAIGAALVLPVFMALVIFAAMGLGLALPYLVLAFVPAARRYLPKPGAWMETFRQFLAFPMFATSAWLVWVVSQQAGPMGVLGALIGLVLIAFAFWLLGHTPKNKFWYVKLRVLALVALASAFLLAPATQMDTPQQGQTSYTFGEPFSPEVLNEALRGPDPVFVEMTAAWCISCKVNHAVAINTDTTKALFKKYNIRYLIGDWTNKDPMITEYLKSFGRNGVPIYIYYGPPDATGKRPAPLMLPQILTTGIVADAVTP